MESMPAAAVPAVDQIPPPADPPPAKRSLDATQECIQLKVQFGKDAVTVERPLDTTVGDLKKDIEERTGIPPSNQKLLYKGQLKDASTLREAGLKSGSKIMVIGSAPKDALKASLAEQQGADKGIDWDVPKAEECWSETEQHKKIIAKGRPDDGWPGIKDKQVPLRDDQTYIPGLLNSQGTKVRLTFKNEIGQVWVGSAASTQKVPLGTIHKIEAQAIKGQEEFSIVRLQLGASGSSNLWLYYVPSQSVSGIKLRILGVSALL
ncbi:hypothetical protein N2152v2_001253 [Parachlorella kessleri]